MAVTARATRLAPITLLGTLLALPAALPPASADPPPSAGIAGTVTGPGGVVVPGSTEVYVLRWDEAASEWVDGPSVYADDQGHYAASGLVAGTYRLLFEPQGVNWLSEWWMNSPAFATATDIVLTAGEQRTAVDEELRPAGHIIGTAHAPDGSVLNWLDVIAWPSDDGPPNGHGIGGSGGSASYHIDRLEPGTYRVQIIDDRGVLPSEFWNDAPTFAQATDIVVGLGQTVTLGDSVLGVAPPPVVVANTARPTITGQAVVGRRLTAGPGSWSPAGVTYAYQWLAGGKAIKGATKARLKLTAAQQGRKISVRVTASVAGATPATVTSKATRKVKPKPKRQPRRHSA